MKEKISEGEPRKQGGGGRRRERSRSFVHNPASTGSSLLAYQKNKGKDKSLPPSHKATKKSHLEEKKEETDFVNVSRGPRSLIRSSSLSKIDAAKKSPITKKSSIANLFSRKKHPGKEKENSRNQMGSDSSLPPLSPTKSPSGGSKGRIISARSGDLMTVRSSHETLSSNAQLMLQHLAATQGPSKKDNHQQHKSSKSKKEHPKSSTNSNAASLDADAYLSPEIPLTKSSLQQRQYLQSRYRQASADAIKPIDLQ